MAGVTVLQRDLSEKVYRAFLTSPQVAWDIETNGLDPHSSSIGTCQLFSPVVGACIVTDVADGTPTRLAKLLADARVVKVFHHAPFDLSFMAHAWGVDPTNVACTKVASKLLKPDAPNEEHSLKSLMWEHFGLRLDKSLRFTDWLSKSLTDQQLDYAIGDVVKLLDLYGILSGRLAESGLSELYGECCAFLPTHVQLRLHGCANPFSY